MPIQAAQLMVNVNANTAAARAELTGFAGLLGKSGVVGLGAGIAIAAIGAVGVVATKMAGDFQAGMTTLVTGAGEAAGPKGIGKVRDAILKMAVDTGTSTKQLTDGMFMIESAGYHAANGGLKVLQAAAEGAKVGNADLGVVADAVTTVMKDYEDQNVSAAQATNTLIATVQSGKTHMQDLAMSLSQVLPTAASAHVGLNDVMGAMATMTGSGVDAASAATYLRQTIIALDAPGANAVKTLDSIGIKASDVGAAMQLSLPRALAMITDALREKFPAGAVVAQQEMAKVKAGTETFAQAVQNMTANGAGPYIASLKEIAGGMRQMQGLLDLTGSHMADFTANVKDITDKVNAGGDSIMKWNMVQDTFNYKVDKAKEVVQVLMIELGQKLLPVATQLVGFLADHAIPTIQHFIEFITGTSTAANVLRPILAIVAIAIAGALVAAFVAWAVAAAAAAVATIAATWPILAIGAAIALLVAGIVLLVTHWREIAAELNKSEFGRIVLATIRNIAQEVGNLIGMLGGLAHAVGTVLGAAGNVAHAVHIPGFAGGGTMPDTGWAVVGESGPELLRLPGGTQIMPTPSGLPGGGGSTATGAITIHITTTLDGRVIAQNTAKHLPGVLRQATGTRSF